MNEAKEAAARRAAELVIAGMTVGLGSGTTAELAVEILGTRHQEGLHFSGVPTSEKTATLARHYGIPLVTLDEAGILDLTIDGADEVDPKLNLIKGHGGALLREKLVAEATRFYLVVVDDSKLVSHLGEHSPVPVEVVPFGWKTTQARLMTMGIECQLRGEPEPFVTDGHNYILDCRLVEKQSRDWLPLANAIKLQTGVVEHGLFLSMASEVMVGYPDGRVRTIEQRSCV